MRVRARARGGAVVRVRVRARVGSMVRAGVRGGRTHKELDRVGVERGEGERRLELVVLLVDALVQDARVEGPVGVEEEHLQGQG